MIRAQKFFTEIMLSRIVIVKQKKKEALRKPNDNEQKLKKKSFLDFKDLKTEHFWFNFVKKDSGSFV